VVILVVQCVGPSACVGIHQLLNRKMQGETLKFVVTQVDKLCILEGGNVTKFVYIFIQLLRNTNFDNTN